MMASSFRKLYFPNASKHYSVGLLPGNWGRCDRQVAANAMVSASPNIKSA